MPTSPAGHSGSPDQAPAASLTITRHQLTAALLAWEEASRAGDCRTHAETAALPPETVAIESAAYLWPLFVSMGATQPPTKTLPAPAATFTGAADIPAIGSVWPGQGGIYAGLVRGAAGQPDWHLIVPTDASAQRAGIAWGGAGKDEPGATSDRDGLANTLALNASKHAHPAAEWAQAIRVDGHTDFYLPARNELRLAYLNVPELFEASAWHWSSTQYSRDYAWFQYFDGGNQGDSYKSYEGRARAVRRLVLQSFNPSIQAAS